MQIAKATCHFLEDLRFFIRHVGMMSEFEQRIMLINLSHPKTLNCMGQIFALDLYVLNTEMLSLFSL